MSVQAFARLALCAVCAGQFALLTAAAQTPPNETPPYNAAAPSPRTGRIDLPRPGPEMADPVYPAESLRLREEGTVAMTLCVSEDGVVEEAVLDASSGHPRLDAAALDWARAGRMQPAMADSVPVGVCEFKLEHEWSLEDAASFGSPSIRSPPVSREDPPSPR